jgi:hypothetical protein
MPSPGRKVASRMPDDTVTSAPVSWVVGIATSVDYDDRRTSSSRGDETGGH